MTFGVLGKSVINAARSTVAAHARDRVAIEKIQASKFHFVSMVQSEPGDSDFKHVFLEATSGLTMATATGLEEMQQDICDTIGALEDIGKMWQQSLMQMIPEDFLEQGSKAIKSLEQRVEGKAQEDQRGAEVAPSYFEEGFIEEFATTSRALASQVQVKSDLVLDFMERRKGLKDTATEVCNKAGVTLDALDEAGQTESESWQAGRVRGLAAIYGAMLDIFESFGCFAPQFSGKAFNDLLNEWTTWQGRMCDEQPPPPFLDIVLRGAKAASRLKQLMANRFASEFTGVNGLICNLLVALTEGQVPAVFLQVISKIVSTLR